MKSTAVGPLLLVHMSVLYAELVFGPISARGADALTRGPSLSAQGRLETLPEFVVAKQAGRERPAGSRGIALFRIVEIFAGVDASATSTN